MVPMLMVLVPCVPSRMLVFPEPDPRESIFASEVVPILMFPVCAVPPRVTGPDVVT